MVTFSLFSKKLQLAKIKYSAFDRKLLVTFLAIKNFKHLLEGQPICVYTDHKPQTFAVKSANQNYTKQQAWHLSFISEFTTDLCHIAGKNNLVADALSCMPIDSVSTVSMINYISTRQKNWNILKNCYNFFNSWLIIIKLHMYVLYLFAINMSEYKLQL